METAPALGQAIGLRLATGEPSALAEAYAAFAPSMLSYVTRFVGPTDAEDVVQRTFLDAWRFAPGYDPDTNGRHVLQTRPQPVIREQDCVGCALCANVCPVDDCISMVSLPSGREPVTWDQLQQTDPQVTTDWPAILALLRNPRERCLEILMKSSRKPTTPRPVNKKSTSSAEADGLVRVSRWLRK